MSDNLLVRLDVCSDFFQWMALLHTIKNSLSIYFVLLFISQSTLFRLIRNSLRNYITITILGSHISLNKWNSLEQVSHFCSCKDIYFFKRNSVNMNLLCIIVYIFVQKNIIFVCEIYTFSILLYLFSVY